MKVFEHGTRSLGSLLKTLPIQGSHLDWKTWGKWEGIFQSEKSRTSIFNGFTQNLHNMGLFMQAVQNKG